MTQTISQRKALSQINAARQAPCSPHLSSPGLVATPDSPKSPYPLAAIPDEKRSAIQPVCAAPFLKSMLREVLDLLKDTKVNMERAAEYDNEHVFRGQSTTACDDQFLRRKP